ncbi:MAG: hypothetical protein WBB31_16885, partial [Saprospiraceae bacterium]
MKNLLFFSIALILTSCIQTSYYQVFTTTPTKTINPPERHAIITYDLWNNGGVIVCSIYNSGTEDIIVDLTKSFLVLNGTANEYFQNRTFTTSALKESTYVSRFVPTVTSAIGSGVTISDKKELTIPPKSRIVLSQFNLVDERYSNCDLKKTPLSKDPKSVKFDRENSPIVANSIISYTYGTSFERAENEFYVSEIGNYLMSNLYE